jgi:hypothetical protein
LVEVEGVTLVRRRPLLSGGIATLLVTQEKGGAEGYRRGSARTRMSVRVKATIAPD